MSSASILSMPVPGSSKKQWRRYARAHRNLLSLADHAQASAQVRAQLQAWSPYQAAEHILLYSPTASELDMMPLAQQKDKHFYLTRTWQGSKQLTVHRLSASTRLEPHPYGYQQPTVASAPIAPEIISLVLVPGLVFDAQGGRIGYGGGYYDRLLAAMPQAYLVGTVLDALWVPQLDGLEPHDLRMHALVSEQRVSVVQ